MPRLHGDKRQNNEVPFNVKFDLLMHFVSFSHCNMAYITEKKTTTDTFVIQIIHKAIILKHTVNLI